MHAALPQKHLNISLMRLRAKVVDEEDGKVYLFADNHCGNLSITTKRAGMHADDIRLNSFLFKGIADKSAGSSRTNDGVFGQELRIVQCPFNHVGFTVVVRDKRYF
jgi:hypothetical protein